MAWAGLILSIGLACTPRAAPEGREPAPSRGALSRVRIRELREHESPLRDALAPATQAPWIDVSGADPYRLVPRQRGEGWLAVLRGSRALVALDDELRERARVTLPESPTALCVAGDTVWVGSRYARRLARLRLEPDGGLELESMRELDVDGVADLACADDGLVHVLPADGSPLLALAPSGRVEASYPALRGALRLRREGSYLLELSLFERALRVSRLDARGRVLGELGRIHHDGPLWAFDVVPRGSELLVAVAGVEDKPLVRAHGEFENIDSFAWIYRFGSDGSVRRLGTLDVADAGLVVPKALALRVDERGFGLAVLAAGSGKLLHARFDEATSAFSELRVTSAPVGVSDAVFSTDGRSVTYTSPLLDAFVAVTPEAVKLSHVDPARRPEPEVRLGEALFFTELMAPENTSQGSHSRFSCETCHFEGGVDGRTHYTGRADVSVVTKPLLGLANNRPHFSRALDPDLSSVCHNEFRVAGAGSGSDPWFSLQAARFPWLSELGVERASWGPLELREALLKFFYAFSHAPNPRSQGRSTFTQLELNGARLFGEHCESCHRARLVSDDASSAMPFERWQELIFSRNAPLVWASSDYAKTGVVPYVHERGARIPSLRRLALKPRYFTNGAAAGLPDVLRQFRETATGARHLGDESGVALGQSDQSALLAFLQLL